MQCVQPIQEQGDVISSTKGREGIYIGETSISLAEYVGDHMYDAVSFLKKSHIIKHWMRSHQDLDTAPQFKTKILENIEIATQGKMGK